MRILSSGAKGFLAALVLTGLVGCTAQYRNHGYVPTDDVLNDVVVGRDTRDSVTETIGPPSVAGVRDASGYYYVKSRWQDYAWRAPVEIDREVLAISFDQRGVVSNIERFGLEQGRVVALSRRVTDRNTQGVSFLRQLFGNLGRIDPGSFLDN